jgi:hypothetical protein
LLYPIDYISEEMYRQIELRQISLILSAFSWTRHAFPSNAFTDTYT